MAEIEQEVPVSESLRVYVIVASQGEHADLFNDNAFYPCVDIALNDERMGTVRYGFMRLTLAEARGLRDALNGSALSSESVMSGEE